MNLIACLCIFVLIIKLIDCNSATKTVRFVYNNDVSLTCDSAESSTFYTTTQAGVTTILNSNSNSDKYSFSGNTMTIKTLKKDQIQSSYECNSSSDSTKFVNEVVPYLFKINTEIITVIEENSVEISCQLLVGTENNQNITWSWTVGGNAVALSSRILITSNQTNSKISFQNTNASDAGKYSCHASNQFGSFIRVIELRVKSKLAPLWPFIGIIGEVIVLVLSIYFFETRPNAVKKRNEKAEEEAKNAT